MSFITYWKSNTIQLLIIYREWRFIKKWGIELVGNSMGRRGERFWFISFSFYSVLSDFWIHCFRLVPCQQISYLIYIYTCTPNIFIWKGRVLINLSGWYKFLKFDVIKKIFFLAAYFGGSLIHEFSILFFIVWNVIWCWKEVPQNISKLIKITLTIFWDGR